MLRGHVGGRSSLLYHTSEEPRRRPWVGVERNNKSTVSGRGNLSLSLLITSSHKRVLSSNFSLAQHCSLSGGGQINGSPFFRTSEFPALPSLPLQFPSCCPRRFPLLFSSFWLPFCLNHSPAFFLPDAFFLLVVRLYLSN